MERFRRIDARQIELPHSTIGPNRFCVAAGLALQALQLGPLQTNLAPAEKGGVFGLLKSRNAPVIAVGESISDVVREGYST